jgi:hypothetical protein
MHNRYSYFAIALDTAGTRVECALIVSTDAEPLGHPLVRYLDLWTVVTLAPVAWGTMTLGGPTTYPGRPFSRPHKYSGHTCE